MNTYSFPTTEVLQFRWFILCHILILPPEMYISKCELTDQLTITCIILCKPLRELRNSIERWKFLFHCLDPSTTMLLHQTQTHHRLTQRFRHREFLHRVTS